MSRLRVVSQGNICTAEVPYDEFQISLSKFKENTYNLNLGPLVKWALN